MVPPVRRLEGLCEQDGKIHHEWLQCWGVKTGNEPHILEQGNILVREAPDVLYVLVWKGQIGTTESCERVGVCM